MLKITGLYDKANKPARTLTLLQRKRLELARALAMQPKLLLLDEIAGGLTEHECAELVKTIKEIHAGGTTIVWIEHIVHALVSVDQPAGRDELRPGLGRRRSARGHGESEGAGSVHGHPGVMTLLQTQNLSAFYGDFQALFDINVTVDEGETVAIIGANGAGKTTFLRAVAGALETAPDMVMFDGQPDRSPHGARYRAARHCHGAGGAPAVSKPFGGGKPSARRLQQAPGPVESSTRL